MRDEQERILAAKSDERIFEELIEDHKTRILRIASQTVGHYVSESDDEWSITLMAFSEAVQSFSPEKGSFSAFSAIVIRRRLIDYLRSEDSHGLEISVSPEAFDGARSDSADMGAENGIHGEILRKTVRSEADDVSVNAKAEIAEMQEILKRYGFSFFDLAASSPKAEKTKTACASAIRSLIADRELLRLLREKRQLPIRELSAASKIQRKILDRHRKYIIAAAEILDGDFPVLFSYLRSICGR